MPTMRSPPAFEAPHPDALAIYCSDGRFTDAVEDLLHSLGHARLDTLTLPGGPALFEVRHSDFSGLETIRKAATFLVRGHGIKHVVLLAHEACGYYRERNAGLDSERIPAKQVADLRAAASWFNASHATVAVRQFYARVVEGRVVFEQIGEER